MMDPHMLASPNSLERLHKAVEELRRRRPDGPAGDERAAIVEELQAAADELRGGPHRDETLERVARDAQAQRLRYQEMFDFAPDAYVVTDAHGVILDANHAAAALLQTAKEFLPGKPLPFFLAEGRRSDLYARISRLNRAEVVEHWETLVRPPRGQPRYADVAVAAVPAGDGRPTGYRWLMRDITGRKRAEQELSAVKGLADSLVDTIDAIVMVIDALGRIVRSNPFLRTIAGYADEELRGRDWCMLLLGLADRPRGRALLGRAVVSGAEKGRVLDLVTSDGRTRAIAWSIRALPDGEPPHLVLVGFDVTDQQEAQRRAVQAERLAAIGQMVAGLAHECRNALQRGQACLSMLDLRLRDRPEELDLLARLQKAQDDMRQLFNDVQGYAAPIKLDPQVCDLAEVWQEGWTDLATTIAGAQLVEELGETDRLCCVSPFHLRQVFRNLLDNAVSVARGSARVVIRCRDGEIDGQAGIEVAIGDNGPGFTPEQRLKAFEPFFTTKVRGTGLGLAICKRIVEAHGGRIEVSNRPGPGAEVVITLPRRTS